MRPSNIRVGLIRIAIVSIMICVGSLCALAIPVKWEFDFDLINIDTNMVEGKAVGSFFYDADVNSYYNIAFETTPGDVFPGATYGYVDPLYTSGADSVKFVNELGVGDGTTGCGHPGPEWCK